MTLIHRQKNADFSLSPFDLAHEAAYQSWRENKLANQPVALTDSLVEIKDPQYLSVEERSALLLQCQRNNMALYALPQDSVKETSGESPIYGKQILQQFCAQLGLNKLDNNLCADEDGISSIQIEPKGTKQEYIPYSDHLINWHTDGYYNSLEQTIRAMVLHCVRPSAEGGCNAFIDHERIYIELRDRDAAYIEALMQQDVMTIPANIQAGVEIRPAQTGPVFSVDADGQLHMRYTARTRSIEWKQDSVTQQAVETLSDLLSGSADYIYQHRLSAGQGIISNNVLHSRTHIVDSESQTRLLYRARFLNRVLKE